MSDGIQQLIDKEVKEERQRCIDLLILHLPIASMAKGGENHDLFIGMSDGLFARDVAEEGRRKSS